MLDPWIIEEILKKEKERRDGVGDRAELPIERHRNELDDRPVVTPPREENERGVMIIDI